MYTEWYWRIDLHNLFHFLRLRLDVHAQGEIRRYAAVMADMVKAACPVAYEAFVDYTLNTKTFSGPEWRALKQVLDGGEPDVDTLTSCGLLKREAREFLAKLEHIRHP